MNKNDLAAKLRIYRQKTNNAATKKYEKTKAGFLMRAYRNMLSRTSGIQKAKFHLYQGKSLSVSKEEFYSWSLVQKDFHKLFTCWEKNLYDRKLTPSVDRLDSSKGYSFDNMEWTTHSENSRRGPSKK